MEPENQTPAVETDATDKTQPATSAATINTDTEPKEILIPKSRFDEVNDKLRKLEADAAKKANEQQAKDDEKLAQDKEWQKLYEGRKAKVEELTPKAELADKLSAMVLEQYAAEIKEWPEQVRNMAPADDKDILTKLDWMKRAKPLATELMGDKAPTPGNGRRPTPVSPANVAKAADEQRTQWQKNAARRYR